MGLAYALRKLMVIITSENIFGDMISMSGLSHSRFLIRNTGNDPSMCWCVTRLSFSNASKDPSCTKAQLPLCCCFYLTGQCCVGGWGCILWHICGACGSPRFPHRPPCTCSSCSKASLVGSSRQWSNEATKQPSGASPATLEACMLPYDSTWWKD